MIEVKFHGDSWAELEQQIAGMIREGQQSGEANPALEKENRKLWDDLSNAQLTIGQLEKELDAAEKRIAELEKAMDKVEAENPTPNAATTADTETTAPTTGTDPAPEQPTYKMEEVRAFLSSAREAGVNIAQVLKPFGGRLPAVAEEDYPALMDAAKAALAEVKEKK